MKFSTGIVSLFLQLSAGVIAADTNAWKSRNIYFALTDRIARSGSDNGGGSCGNLGDYCGGTFKGLESKLDYIKGMGFDAIWITPVVESEYQASNPWPLGTQQKQQQLTENRHWWRLSWLLGAGSLLRQLPLR